MSKNIFPVFLVFCGIVYILKPDIFKTWFKIKNSLMQRSLSPENYKLCMRLLGITFIGIGAAKLVSQYPVH